ncbi:MAG: hypothetical protein LKI30_03965 [Bifidobacterium crudilactis]|jgi:hypothetical protein|nr:hypothetical protein [Bifidobacterium crudilactis]
MAVVTWTLDHFMDKFDVTADEVASLIVSYDIDDYHGRHWRGSANEFFEECGEQCVTFDTTTVLTMLDEKGIR